MPSGPSKKTLSSFLIDSRPLSIRAQTHGSRREPLRNNPFYYHGFPVFDSNQLHPEWENVSNEELVGHVEQFEEKGKKINVLPSSTTVNCKKIVAVFGLKLPIEYNKQD